MKLSTKRLTESMLDKIVAHPLNPRGWSIKAREGLAKSIESNGVHERNGRPVIHADKALDGWNRLKALLAIRETNRERFDEIMKGGVNVDVLAGRATDKALLEYVKPDDMGQVSWTTQERIAVYCHAIGAGLSQDEACIKAGYSGRNSMLIAAGKLDSDTQDAIVLDGQRQTPVITNAEIIALGKVASEAEKSNPAGFAKGKRGAEYDAAADKLRKTAKAGKASIKAKHATSKQVLALVSMISEHDYNGPMPMSDVVDLLTAVTGCDPATDKPTAENPAAAWLANRLTELATPKPVAKARKKAKARKTAKA